MRHFFRISWHRAVVAAAFATGLFASCAEKVLGPNELEGDTNLPLTKVGNATGMYVTVDGVSLQIRDTMYITRNDNGIVTYHVQAEVAGNPLAALIPADLKDSTGNVNADIRLKITSDGIQEYYNGRNDLNRPFTMVKYGGNVGDTYEFDRPDGKHVARTITEKTERDEWPLGFYLIKTIAVEETATHLEGVKKVVFRANHKYGLVYIEWQLTSGQVAKLYLAPPM